MFIKQMFLNATNFLTFAENLKFALCDHFKESQEMFTSTGGLTINGSENALTKSYVINGYLLTSVQTLCDNYRPQGNLLFSEAVCQSFCPRGGGAGEQTHLNEDHPGGLPNPPGCRLPMEAGPLAVSSSVSHCSGRYTSYWNAFLFQHIFAIFSMPTRG